LKLKIFIALLPLYANAITQLECVDLIYTEAKKWTKYPTTIAGEAMQETSCGVHLIGDLNKKINKASIGVLQFQLRTAREELEKIQGLKHIARYSDIRLITELLTNHKLSARLASTRFERYRKAYGYKVAVQAHNGLNGNFRYYRKVMKWKKWVIKHRSLQNEKKEKKK
jgi:hypothetical protein